MNEFQKVDLENLSDINDFKSLHNHHLVDMSKKLPAPPTAIGIGEIEYRQNIYPRAFGTYGNFSVIVGMPKAGKTYFKSLMTGAYIGGQSTRFAPKIKGYRQDDAYILDFDTEQGDWHVQNVAQRTLDIVGSKYPNYKPFGLRSMNFMERIEFIEYCLLEHPIYRKKAGLVIIDGYADLVADVNDLKECNLMVQKLMKWTEISKCHITGVVHQAYGNAKATGHLGSAITKKAETVCFLEREKNGDEYTGITSVRFPATRGWNIDTFGFKIENGFPYVVEQDDILGY